MNTRYYIYIGIALLVGGYSAGRYVQPAKVVTKEVQVVKEVEVVKKDVKTVIKMVERPDGTKETVTTIEDKSKETTKKDSKSQKSVEVLNVKPQWKVQALVGLDSDVKPVYGGGIERRILGPVSAGVWATTSKNIGVSVSLEF